ncbi:MAG: hypothetical protein QNJ33_19660 [Crocosphaera sp.]|nr:hypothetical protein [Crocosphaera sp.]
MNEPATVTYDLTEILKRIENKLDTMQKDLTDLKVGQARLEEKLTGDIKTLDTKIEGIGKRLDYQEFINRGVVIGLIVALLGGLAKMFGWIGNP